MSKATSNRRNAARNKSQKAAARASVSRGNQLRIWILGVICVGLIGAAIWFALNPSGNQTALEASLPNTMMPGSNNEASTGNNDGSLPTGAGMSAVAEAVRGVETCRRQPQFAQNLQFGVRTVFGTALPGHVGLVIYDPDEGTLYQHPTWDDAGNLGPYVIDGLGNLYVSPVPLSSLELNPPEEQNRIYRVDSSSGEMSLYLDLPAAQPPSQFNPYGVVGLGMDCTTQSIYAASLTGSTPTEEVGRIYRVDLQTGQIAGQLDDVDAIGVGVGVFSDGSRRLFYGLARSSEVRSVALDAQGNFIDDTFRTEFALATLPGGRNERAHRIRFDGQGRMTIKGLEFNYSLQVSGQIVYTDYWLQYVPERDEWEVVDIQRETTSDSAMQ